LFLHCHFLQVKYAQLSGTARCHSLQAKIQETQGYTRRRFNILILIFTTLIAHTDILLKKKTKLPQKNQSRPD